MFKKQKKDCKKGAAVLSLVLIISFIIVTGGVSIAVAGMGESLMSSGYQRASEAMFIAEAGAKDGLMKIARKKNFESAGYVFLLGNGQATVKVEKHTPQVGYSTITSTARVGNIYRKIRVVATVSNDGKVSWASWQELTD